MHEPAARVVLYHSQEGGQLPPTLPADWFEGAPEVRNDDTGHAIAYTDADGYAELTFRLPSQDGDLDLEDGDAHTLTVAWVDGTQSSTDLVFGQSDTLAHRFSRGGTHTDPPGAVVYEGWVRDEQTERFAGFLVVRRSLPVGTEDEGGA